MGAAASEGVKEKRDEPGALLSGGPHSEARSLAALLFASQRQRRLAAQQDQDQASFSTSLAAVSHEGTLPVKELPQTRPLSVACVKPLLAASPRREGDMRKKEPARVLGPYREGGLWRIIIVDELGHRRSATVANEREALRLVAREREKIEGHTVGWAIGEWTAARERSGVILPRTGEQQTTRLQSMLATVLDRPLASITAMQAQALYDQHATQLRRKERPIAAATNRFDLGLARTMWKWAMKRGHVGANVWDVEPIGRPRKGKAQLTGKEAGRLIAQAHSEAILWKHPLAVATLCCLLIGVRSSEALGITASDLDGTHVRIRGTKTETARRRLRMPELLRVHLERLAAQATAPEERLFPYDRKQLYFFEVLLCRRAGVPRVTPHGLRATWATLSVDGGDSVEAVSRALGHSNLAVTLGHYVSRDAANNAKTAGFERAVIVPESFRNDS